MILDATLLLDSNHAITATAASQGVIDLAGLGSGNAVTNRIGVQNAVFGQDIGIGDGESPPQILCLVGTAFATANNATLQVQLEAAVDNGAGSPGAWDIIAETDALPASVLTAGQKLAQFTIPHRYPGQGFPRFYRLNYAVGTGAFTAGTIAYAGIVTGRDDTPMYPSAF